MPKPKPNETQEEFIGRCIPILINEGKPEDQASAICYSIWENKEKGIDNMKEIKKFFPAEIKSSNDEKLIIEHFISTESTDRSKDNMLADGMTMDGWPVVLQEHGFGNSGYEPIAKCLSLTMETNDKGVKGIIAKTQYYNGSHLSPPDNTGQRLYEKAKGDYMPYFSIRFRSLEEEPKTDGGTIFKRWLLLEYSQVGIPDNIEAAVKKAMTEKDVEEKGTDLVKYTVVKSENDALKFEIIKNDFDKTLDEIKELMVKNSTDLLQLTEKVSALSVSLEKNLKPIEKPEENGKPEGLSISKEEIQELVKDSLKSALQKEINIKIKGKAE